MQRWALCGAARGIWHALSRTHHSKTPNAEWLASHRSGTCGSTQGMSDTLFYVVHPCDGPYRATCLPQNWLVLRRAGHPGAVLGAPARNAALERHAGQPASYKTVRVLQRRGAFGRPAIQDNRESGCGVQGISDALSVAHPPEVLRSSPILGTVVATPASAGGRGVTGGVPAHSAQTLQAEGHAEGRQAVHSAVGFTKGAAAEVAALATDATQSALTVRCTSRAYGVPVEIAEGHMEGCEAAHTAVGFTKGG